MNLCRSIEYNKKIFFLQANRILQENNFVLTLISPYKDSRRFVSFCQTIVVIENTCSSKFYTVLHIKIKNPYFLNYCKSTNVEQFLGEICKLLLPKFFKGKSHLPVEIEENFFELKQPFYKSQSQGNYWKFYVKILKLAIWSSADQIFTT